MTGFIIVAALLVVAVLAILLPPLLPTLRRTPRSSGAADRSEANLAIFRDQIKELEREHHDGLLTDADFEQSRSELQRRLLDEVEPPTAELTDVPGGRRTALTLLLIIPLAAAAGYALLGNPRALDPLQRQASLAPEQIEAMVAGPVSYTHLDVYKRQGSDRRPAPGRQGRCNPRSGRRGERSDHLFLAQVVEYAASGRFLSLIHI